MKKLLAVCLVAASFNSFAAPSLLSEGFDDISTLAGDGWVMTNESVPVGTTGWSQGNSGIFPADSGAASSYIAANYLNADVAGGSISNWLISPELSFSGPGTLKFALRFAGQGFLDTVEVYFSNGASTATGGFSLLDTFSSDTDNGWLAKSIVIGGAGFNDGRFGFRYVVDDNLVNGNYIGIDSVSVDGTEVVPEPASLALLSLALAGVAALRRRG